MLLGGLFLYISYYGCDQSQVQRELSTKSIDDTNLALFLNGVLRFPLVLTYCFLGLCIAGYVTKHPEFISLLPVDENGPNYNMAVPIFVIKYFPAGAVGLVMVGLFSAAMSSLDSVINSLSATTLKMFSDLFLEKSILRNKNSCFPKYLQFFGVLFVRSLLFTLVIFQIRSLFLLIKLALSPMDQFLACFF